MNLYQIILEGNFSNRFLVTHVEISAWSDHRGIPWSSSSLLHPYFKLGSRFDWNPVDDHPLHQVGLKRGRGKSEINCPRCDAAPDKGSQVGCAGMGLRRVEKMQFCVCFASFKRLIWFWGVAGLGGGRCVGDPLGSRGHMVAALICAQINTRLAHVEGNRNYVLDQTSGRNCSTSWVKCKQQYYLLECVPTARKPVSSAGVCFWFWAAGHR